MTVERFDARTWPGKVLDELFADAFPAFITADLSTLHIDREQDRGRYVEPNVWVRHR